MELEPIRTFIRHSERVSWARTFLEVVFGSEQSCGQSFRSEGRNVASTHVVMNKYVHTENRAKCVASYILIIVTIVVFTLLLMMVFMMPVMGMMWSVDGAPGAGTGMSPVWVIGMMLVFLLVLLGIGYLLYRSFTQGLFSADDPALVELRLAYARGELSQEEFEQHREDL